MKSVPIGVLAAGADGRPRRPTKACGPSTTCLPPTSRPHSGVDVTPAWLARVQRAVVRLSVGCSGSVVSGQGLVLTNNHCAQDCAHDLATPGHDLARDGALAATPAEEKTCPTLRAEILESVDDVTPRMRAAGAWNPTGEALVKAVNAALSRERLRPAAARRPTTARSSTSITAANTSSTTTASTGRPPGVRRRRAIGFFGGDPDNFNFPRYDLDVAFLRRLRERPARSPPTQHLRWYPTHGAGAGELVFVAGNPGSTAAWLTTAAARDPARLQQSADQIAQPGQAARPSDPPRPRVARSEAPRRRRACRASSADDLNNVGEVASPAQHDPACLHHAASSKAELRTEERSATGARGFADPQSDSEPTCSARADITTSYPPYHDLRERARCLAPVRLRPPSRARLPSEFVRYAEEITKIDCPAVPTTFRDSNLDSLKFQLLSPASHRPRARAAALLTVLALRRPKRLLGIADTVSSSASLGGIAPDRRRPRS